MYKERDKDNLYFLFSSERLEDLTAMAIAAVIMLIVLLLY